MTLVVSRTPLRASFVGGGSDLPSYYSTNGGQVVSTTLNYWIDVVVRSQPNRLSSTYKINCQYSPQNTEDPQEIFNPFVREAIYLLKIKAPIEICSFSDIPPGTGLGSSGAFSVGLLHALHYYLGNQVTWEQLQEEAHFLETQVLRKPVGKQDQAIASFGGISHFKFNPDSSINAEKVACKKKTLLQLEQNFMMLFLGKSRDAASILSTIKGDDWRQGDLLKKLCSFCEPFKNILQEGKELAKIGEMLDEAWKLKRALSDSISTPEIDNIYRIAKANGALGGKLLGAGRSGFFLLYADLLSHNNIRKALPQYQFIPFKLSDKGSYIALYKP